MGSQQTIKKLLAQIIQPAGKAVTNQGFFKPAETEICLRDVNNYFCPAYLGYFKMGDVSCV